MGAGDRPSVNTPDMTENIRLTIWVMKKILFICRLRKGQFTNRYIHIKMFYFAPLAVELARQNKNVCIVQQNGL